MRVFLLSLFDEWCLGLRSLSASLRTKGHDTALACLRSVAEMHDEAGKGDPDGYHVPPGSVTGADLRALTRLVEEFRPGLVGISLTSNYVGLARVITERLRAVTQAPVVWGGVDPTANPDLAIQSADIVCLGEGEGAIVELAERVASGRSYADVQNLWVRENGAIRRNPVRPLIQDLDALPWPDFGRRNKFYIHGGEARPGALPDVSNLRTSYPLLAGRGCPFACAFCCNSMYRKLYGARGYVRSRSVAGVVAEIAHAVRANPRIEIVEFHDDVFAVKPGWLEQFAEVYPKRIGLPFSCYTHPNLCTPQRASALKRAGVAFTIMGIQTGSNRFLRDLYRRNTSRENILRTARLLNDAGIPIVIDLITGTPLDTEEDHRATLDLMLELPPGYVLHEVNRLSIYRNHPIADILAEKGLLNPWCAGRNVTSATETKESRFWYAMLSLVEFEELGRDTIRAMADDPYLRERPEIVEAICKTLQDAKYVPGTRRLRCDRERQLTDELARLKGSRAVRWYFGLKDRLRRERRPD